MSRAPLLLRFPTSEQSISCVPDALVSIEGEARARHVEVFSYDSHLGSRRSLGRLEGGTIGVDAITTIPGTGRIFAAGAEGMFELNLDGAAPARVAGPPDRFAPGASYVWAVAADAGRDRVYAYAGPAPATSNLLVEIDSSAHRIVSQIPLPGFCAGIRIEPALGLVALPMSAAGPELRDLQGTVLAKLSGTARDADIRRFDGAILLAGDDAGILEWNWKTAATAQRVDRGRAPRWCPDGSFVFLSNDAELWHWRDGQTSPLVQLNLDDARPTVGAVSGPRVSPDGRFVLAFLALERGPARQQTAVVVERATGHVRQVPGWYSPALAWT